MSKDYLGKVPANGLKGIAALMVLSHHLYLTSGVLTDSILRAIPQAFGYLAVAIFFFLSGYGLWQSVKVKGDDYIQSFGRQRVIPFYAVIACLVMIYAFVRSMIGTLSWRALLRAFFRDTGVIEYGWYFYVILYAYCLFWLVCQLFMHRPKLQLRLLACIVFVNYGFGLCFKQSSLSYECVPALMLGVMWSEKRAEIDDRIEKHLWLCFAVCCSASIATYIGNHIAPWKSVAIILKTASALSFVAAVMILMQKISPKGAVLQWLGTHSREIYAFQGIPILLLQRTRVHSVPMLYILLTVALTLLCAALMYPVFCRLQRTIKEIRQSGKA